MKKQACVYFKMFSVCALTKLLSLLAAAGCDYVGQRIPRLYYRDSDLVSVQSVTNLWFLGDSRDRGSQRCGQCGWPIILSSDPHSLPPPVFIRPVILVQQHFMACISYQNCSHLLQFFVIHTSIQIVSPRNKESLSFFSILGNKSYRKSQTLVCCACQNQNTVKLSSLRFLYFLSRTGPFIFKRSILHFCGHLCLVSDTLIFRCKPTLWIEFSSYWLLLSEGSEFHLSQKDLTSLIKQAVSINLLIGSTMFCLLSGLFGGTLNGLQPWRWFHTTLKRVVFQDNLIVFYSSLAAFLYFQIV